MIKPLKCFVAMAFNRPDTDQLYAKAIKPILCKHHIKPIRIDKITHNEEINNKIISEMQSCDFALADLTYARPSVYYEAGYCQGRPVSVLYLCRHDHFEGTEDHQKVHFDLKMKNAIKWKHPKDRLFLIDFRKRLKHIISPLLKSKEKNVFRQKSIQEFSRQSMNEKLKAIDAIVDSKLFQIGFLKTNAYWVKKRGGKLIVVYQFVVSKLNSSELLPIKYRTHIPEFNLNDKANKKSISNIERYIFVHIIEKTAQESFLSRMFQDFKKESRPKSYFRTAKVVVPYRMNKTFNFIGHKSGFGESAFVLSKPGVEFYFTRRVQNNWMIVRNNSDMHKKCKGFKMKEVDCKTVVRVIDNVQCEDDVDVDFSSDDGAVDHWNLKHGDKR